LSDLGIHASEAIGPAGQFNLLQTLTLLLAGLKQRKAVTGRNRVNRRFLPCALGRRSGGRKFRSSARFGHRSHAAWSILPRGGLSVKNGMRFAN
jgi:hypothetical protein